MVLDHASSAIADIQVANDFGDQDDTAIFLGKKEGEEDGEEGADAEGEESEYEMVEEEGEEEQDEMAEAATKTAVEGEGVQQT